MLSKITVANICLILYLGVSKSFAFDLQVVTESSPPHQMWENNQVSGTVTEKVKELLNKSGLTATYNIYPWARAYNIALNEPDTLIYSIAKTDKRLDLFHWLMPIITYEFGFVGLSTNKNIDISTKEQLAKYVVAVQRNDIAHEWMLNQKFEEGKHFIISANINNSWQLLLNKNVDLIIESQHLISHMLGRFNKPDNFVSMIKKIPELNTIGYLAASKNIAADKLAKLQAAIQIED